MACLPDEQNRSVVPDTVIQFTSLEETNRLSLTSHTHSLVTLKPQLFHLNTRKFTYSIILLAIRRKQNLIVTTHPPTYPAP
eukprot:scaffold64136_cov39-Prasinocladus_malaysianus.AAC.1